MVHRIFLSSLLFLGSVSAQTALTFWPSSNPEEIDFAKTVTAAWNKANPQTPIKMQPLPASRSTEEVLLAAIAARTTPDVAANIYPGAISQFVAAGGLYAHNKLPDFKSFMTARSGADVLDAYTSGDNNVYQIPWKSSSTTRRCSQVTAKMISASTTPMVEA
jgi:multiple sugar transport system substrate-binding protein